MMATYWRLAVGVCLALLALPYLVHGQEPAVGSSSLAWQMDEADAPVLTYLLGVNGAAPVPIGGAVTCTPANGTLHDCRVGVDALGLDQGQYSLTVQARRTVAGVNFDSGESSALSIVRAEMPADATNLVIIVEAP